jgi:hypothetical protein
MKLRLLAVGIVVLAAAAPAGSARHPVSSFTRPHVIPLAMRSDSLLLVDVNHDRHLDLVASTGNRLSPLVLVAFGDGKGHFHRRVTSHVFWADNLSTGDVNGDGNVDLVSSDDLYCPNVQLGDGQGGFAAGAQMPHCFTGSWPPAYLATLGDITGDGKLDLVWCSNAFAMVLAGDGHGAFQRTSGTPIFGGYPVPYDMNRIVIADVNHDGFGDLVGAGPNGLSVSPGREDGTLGEATTYSFPREPSGWGHGPAEDVAVADLNHDGYGDFLVALAGAEPPDPPGHGRIAVLSGSRSGVLTPGPLYSAGRVYLPSSIALGDLNRDGKLDLVVADVVSRGFSRLLGVRGGRFGAPLVVANKKYPIAVRATAGEVTGDRLPDVVLSGGQTTSTFVLVFAGRRR